jgi:hypothetical protein
MGVAATGVTFADSGEDQVFLRSMSENEEEEVAAKAKAQGESMNFCAAHLPKVYVGNEIWEVSFPPLL